MATPLWYLRVLLWIFLLSPLIIRAVRRWPVASLTVGAIVVIGLEIVDRSAVVRPAIAPHLVWQVGDVVLYGLFFALGGVGERWRVPAGDLAPMGRCGGRRARCSPDCGG